MFATQVKKLFVYSALVGMAASMSSNALAQTSAAATYPNKPIKLLVGFAPGGGTDAAARTIAIKLTEILGQTVVVDNKPGAGGNIAADLVAKAPGDGYTIGLANIGSLAVNPHMPNGTPYNTLKDFAMLGNGVSFGNVLVVKTDSDIKTFAHYLVAAKNADKPLFYGSSGFGSAGHMSGELLKQRANTTAQHINYKGGGPAMNGLLGGEIQAIFASAPTAIPLIKAGKLRALAVTGAKRAADLPDVPTIAELGFPGYLATNWYSFIAPASTPPAIVKKLNAAIVSAINDQATLTRLSAQGMEPDPSTSEEMRAFVTKEYDTWGKVARTLKF
ncbi:MAG: tripartite tricarboxylate transporter substrate binding protein [Zwartia sp.]|uniref:Bug family tripartite tricarboxylate transporter substrate binding protein n=3 Tax=Zwartia sp. TaxID=2978004 RepID=UPI003C727895